MKCQGSFLEQGPICTKKSIDFKNKAKSSKLKLLALKFIVKILEIYQSMDQIH